MTAKGTYVVLGVESGDRLTLLSSTGVRHDVLIAGVQVPRAGRIWSTGPSAAEEACGFDALEHVRTRCLGRPVQFQPTSDIAALQRTAGSVTLPDGTDAGLSLIEAGLATATDRPPSGMSAAVHEGYVTAARLARLTKNGLWAPNAATRRRALHPYPPVAPADLFAKVSGTTDKLRIERISLGGGMIGVIVSLRAPISVLLTGVRFPTRAEGSEKLAEQAKLAMEQALLHRTVTASFDSINASSGAILVTIVGPKGSFQEELLRQGLVKCGPTCSDAMRRAEDDAKERRVGLWIDYVPPAEGQESAAAAAPTTDRDGIVVGVPSGDTLLIAYSSGEIVRVGLSGVRVPRTNAPMERGASDSAITYPPCAWEARELLRQTFIGHPVRVTMEAPRTTKDGAEVRPTGTVVGVDSGADAAMTLVRQGLARVTFAKADAHAAASGLLAAEATAKKQRLGLHGDAASGAGVKIVSLHRLPEAKAKQYLSFLQRGAQGGRPPRLPAIVETVVSAAIVRVYVPREHLQFALRLGGIVTPSAAPGATPDAYAEEAKDFTTRQALQHDVECEVDTVDRGGNFIGRLFLQGRDFALALISAGFAVPQSGSTPHEWERTLNEAKAAKRGMHATGALPSRVRPAEVPTESDEWCPSPGGEWVPVVLSDVLDGATVCLQNAAAVPIIEAMRDKLSTLASEKPYEGASLEEVVAVRYTDGLWYRGRTRRGRQGGHPPLVQFIDYGTVAEVDAKDTRKLPPSEAFAALRTLPPQSRTVGLAFLRPLAPTHEVCEEAINFMWAFAEKGSLVAVEEYSGAGRSYVSVAMAGSPTTTLNANLLQNGLALLDKRTAAVDRKKYDLFQTAQDVAHRRHLNLWRYGAVAEEDEEFAD